MLQRVVSAGGTDHSADKYMQLKRFLLSRGAAAQELNRCSGTDGLVRYGLEHKLLRPADLPFAPEPEPQPQPEAPARAPVCGDLPESVLAAGYGQLKAAMWAAMPQDRQGLLVRCSGPGELRRLLEANPDCIAGVEQIIVAELGVQAEAAAEHAREMQEAQAELELAVGKLVQAGVPHRRIAACSLGAEQYNKPASSGRLQHVPIQAGRFSMSFEANNVHSIKFVTGGATKLLESWQRLGGMEGPVRADPPDQMPPGIRDRHISELVLQRTMPAEYLQKLPQKPTFKGSGYEPRSKPTNRCRFAREQRQKTGLRAMIERELQLDAEAKFPLDDFYKARLTCRLFNQVGAALTENEVFFEERYEKDCNCVRLQRARENLRREVNHSTVRRYGYDDNYRGMHEKDLPHIFDATWRDPCLHLRR